MRCFFALQCVLSVDTYIIQQICKKNNNAFCEKNYHFVLYNSKVYDRVSSGPNPKHFIAERAGKSPGFVIWGMKTEPAL